MKRNFNRLFVFAVMLVAWVAASAQMVVCTANNVRLRTGPSTSYPMLVWTANDKPVYINKGQSLTYLGDDSRDFYNVQFDGKSVYIAKKYARLENPGDKSKDAKTGKVAKKDNGGAAKVVVVTGDNVRLRKSASLEGAIYSDSKGKPIYPAKGERLVFVDQQGDWYKVKYKGNVLFISKKFSTLQ